MSRMSLVVRNTQAIFSLVNLDSRRAEMGAFCGASISFPCSLSMGSKGASGTDIHVSQNLFFWTTLPDFGVLDELVHLQLIEPGYELGVILHEEFFLFHNSAVRELKMTVNVVEELEFRLTTRFWTKEGSLSMSTSSHMCLQMFLEVILPHSAVFTGVAVELINTPVRDFGRELAFSFLC